MAEELGSLEELTAVDFSVCSFLGDTGSDIESFCAQSFSSLAAVNKEYKMI